MAIFCEQAAHGTSVYCRLGHPDGAGLRAGNGVGCRRMAGLEVRVGIQSHGQGLETTLAQVAARGAGRAGRAGAGAAWRHGDHAVFHRAPGGRAAWSWAGRRGRGGLHGTGRRGSQASAPICCRSTRRMSWSLRTRCAARSAACRSRRVARTWYLRPQDLPDSVNTGGLEVTAGYEGPARQRHVQLRRACLRPFSVDTESGDVRLLDYAICEDGRRAGEPADRGRAR